VGAHHLVRFLVVSLAVAVAARHFPRHPNTPARKPSYRPGFDD
jgi:hypothetical protein